MEAYQRLEREIEGWLGVRNVVACSSGTSALHLALEALQLPQGSEVLIPDYTMVAVARAVVLAGLTPVLVDCSDDLLMDVELANGYERSRATAAVIAVHIYGRRVDMDKLSRPYGEGEPACPWLIEDMAELHGVKPHLLTDAACWSFYRNKVVAGEEGGAVAFRDTNHAVLARQLRSLGFTEEHDFRHVPRGHNYRMSNAHASIISRNFLPCDRHGGTVVDWMMRERRTIEGWYEERCPTEWRMPARQSPWVYDLRIRGMNKAEQDTLVKKLNGVGIAARHGFMPMSMQEEFKRCRRVGDGNAARLASEVIYLPIQPGVVTEGMADRAFRTLRG